LAPSGFTFSLLLALLRAKVEMDSVGRGAGAAVEAFSGEYVSARVAEGVLRCEDVLAVPADVLVRRELLRERRNDEPMSVTEAAMECLLVFLRCCGVEGTLASGAYWLATRGVTSGAGAGAAVGAGGRLRTGGGWR
jgi:hypothetical protein